VSRYDITGYHHDSVVPEDKERWLECLRPDDHKGPHLVRRHDEVGGQFVLWQKDPCFGEELDECPGCQNGDPEDECLIYAEIDQAEARRFITDPSLIVEEWSDPLW
jgi:hypothetical protein